MKVSQVPIKEAFSVSESTSLQDVAQLIKEEKVRHVYVTNKGKELKGVISVFDLSNKVLAEGKDIRKLAAKEIMTSPARSVDFYDELSKAYLYMIELDTFSLPITKDGKIHGVISLRDTLNLLVKEKRNGKTSNKPANKNNRKRRAN